MNDKCMLKLFFCPFGGFWTNNILILMSRHAMWHFGVQICFFLHWKHSTDWYIFRARFGIFELGHNFSWYSKKIFMFFTSQFFFFTLKCLVSPKVFLFTFLSFGFVRILLLSYLGLVKICVGTTRDWCHFRFCYNFSFVSIRVVLKFELNPSWLIGTLWFIFVQFSQNFSCHTKKTFLTSFLVFT